ncbi:MAG: hypothetical protein K9H26_10880 [Prolixibacteraceae bacterium]|nr:hypothetical protein [Prolixibacteraceae bacterium]
MDTIHDRIKLIISHFKMNNNSFAHKIGLTSSTVINNITGGRMSKPSFDVLSMILSAYKEIDANWLITGNGNMIKELKKNNSNELKEPREYYKSKIDYDSEIIEIQRARIETLNKLVKSQEEIILTLKEKIKSK